MPVSTVVSLIGEEVRDVRKSKAEFMQQAGPHPDHLEQQVQAQQLSNRVTHAVDPEPAALQKDGIAS